MTVAAEENCPPTLILTLTLTLTLTGEQFSPGEIVRTPVRTKETKNRKERKNNRRKKEEIKQKALSLLFSLKVAYFLSIFVKKFLTVFNGLFCL